MTPMTEQEIVNLLQEKSRRDREKLHVELLHEFLICSIPKVYCILVERDWVQTIMNQETILIYLDARKLFTTKYLIQLFIDNPKQRFIIDHISELTEKQHEVAQLFYNILDRQVLETGRTIIDFSQYNILMIQHVVEDEYDNFFEYGRKKMVKM